MQKINPSNYSPPNVNYWGDRCCKVEAENARLRKGIQDYLDGNYEPRIKKMDKCPHGTYGYEICEACTDEHFANLLRGVGQSSGETK